MTKYSEYRQYVISVVKEYIAQSNNDAEMTSAHDHHLWGLGPFVACTREILREVLSMQGTVTEILNFRMEHAEAS